MVSSKNVVSGAQFKKFFHFMKKNMLRFSIFYLLIHSINFVSHGLVMFIILAHKVAYSFEYIF